MPTMNIQISLKFHAICAASSVVKLQRFGTERDIIRTIAIYIHVSFYMDLFRVNYSNIKLIVPLSQLSVP